MYRYIQERSDAPALSLLRAVRLDERSQRHHLSRRLLSRLFTSGIPMTAGAAFIRDMRSTNLIDWERAGCSKPDRSLGEEHCFPAVSCCAKGSLP